jgi:hypothetical protein
MLAYTNDKLNPRKAYPAIGTSADVPRRCPPGASPILNFSGKKNSFSVSQVQRSLHVGWNVGLPQFVLLEAPRNQ